MNTGRKEKGTQRTWDDPKEGREGWKLRVRVVMREDEQEGERNRSNVTKSRRCAWEHGKQPVQRQES